MPVTKVIANGTFLVKQGAGYIRNLSVSNAGTTWTLQLFDGPDAAGNADQTVFGGTTAAAITTGLAVINPLYFSKGIKAVLAGGAPAGELDIDWY